MKITLLFFTVLMFIHSEPTIQLDEVKHLNGLYTGTLTYLDYTSNEPVTLPLIGNCYVEKNNLILEFTFNESGKIIRHKYNLEIKNGTIYTDAPLKLEEKRYDTTTKSFRYVFTERGKDGNDDKPCTFRHTVTYDNNVFTMTKDVKFDGENEYFNRNEYKITRLK